MTTSFDEFSLLCPMGVMRLYIFVDTTDPKLTQLYKDSANAHNAKFVAEPNFYDAGFDLFLPLNQDDQNSYGATTFNRGQTNKVNFQVKCCAKINSVFSPFYTYARSSLSKTPLRLANNQGIIDAGYRGNLIGMFDCVENSNADFKGNFNFEMDAYSRVLQICAPGLMPIYVEVVESVSELGPNTSRGEGGFGSTGA